MRLPLKPKHLRLDGWGQKPHLSFFNYSQEICMKHKLVSGLAMAALLGGMSAAAVAQNVAIVNGKAVPLTRVEALSQQVARSGRPVTPEIQQQIKDEVIAREIFMQEAQKMGLDTTVDFKNQMELARQTILIRELFANYQKTNPVTDADIQAEYDKFVAANSGKEYRASHILVEKEADAKAIIAQLKKGGKFEEIAKKSSKDPCSGAKGGDLDWAPAGNYVAEFATALTALKKGQLTDTPVKSQFGFHIIRLDDVRDAQLPKLEEVKPQVSQQLQQQKLTKYQEDLRKKAKIE
jgi:peptidyl-prolyl cis-trans isomerase C